MGWFHHQLELFVVRLLPHIVGVSPLQESYNTPLEHTPGNPPTQLWKDSLYNLLAPHIILTFCQDSATSKPLGSRSTMNTWAQWTLWPSVKMENVGCLRLEIVTEKTQPNSYWRRWNLQKEPQTKMVFLCIFVGDQWIQSGFQFVMLKVLMLVSGRWALGNSLGDIWYSTCCFAANVRSCTKKASQLMANHGASLGGRHLFWSIHSPPMNQVWPERCVSKKDLKRL